MHLKSVLALLFAVVPDLDDAIDTRCSDLESSVEPGSLDKGLGVTLQGSQALASADVPHFAELVAGGRYKKLLSRGKLDIPDSALVTLKRLFESEGARLPDVDRPVLGRSGNQFVVRSNSHSVNVLLMRHDCHAGRVDHLTSATAFVGDAPDLQRVVLGDRCEELLFLGRKAEPRDVLIMTVEGCEALDALLERLCRVKLPKFDRAVLGTTQENCMLVI